MSHLLRPIADPLPEGAAAILNRYPQRDGYLLNLFRVFANSVRFLRKGTVNLLDEQSPLALRQREIVILRVTANLDCEYEWGVHVNAFASAAGLTEEQISATRVGNHHASCWSDEEALLVDALDQLCATGTIEDHTLAQFQRAWTVEQQLEIMALAGNYHTVSYVANTARLEREAFAATFPTARDPVTES